MKKGKRSLIRKHFPFLNSWYKKDEPKMLRMIEELSKKGGVNEKINREYNRKMG